MIVDETWFACVATIPCGCRGERASPAGGTPTTARDCRYAVPVKSASTGALPGPRTAIFSTIGPRPIQKASPGLSARNISGGMPRTIMVMARRVARWVMTSPTFLRQSHQRPRPTRTVMGWMPIPVQIPSPCRTRGVAGSLRPVGLQMALYRRTMSQWSHRSTICSIHSIRPIQL